MDKDSLLTEPEEAQEELLMSVSVESSGDCRLRSRDLFTSGDFGSDRFLFFDNDSLLKELEGVLGEEAGLAEDFGLSSLVVWWSDMAPLLTDSTTEGSGSSHLT